MQSIPSTAEESATPSIFRMAPRVLSAIIEGFTHCSRAGLTSIILGAKGWFATDTHRLVWSGHVPQPGDAKATDLLSAQLEIVRATHRETPCDLTNLLETPGEIPNVSRVLGHDFYPIFDLAPEQLVEIAKLAEALGTERITICSRADLDVTDEKADNASIRIVGFRMMQDGQEPIYCLAMGFRPDGIRPGVKIISAGAPPAIEAVRQEAA